jgi:hypothetical protein
MAVSNVSIANLALQLLGAGRITSLTEDHKNARAVNSCFEFLRDRELRAHAWNFAIKRATLAPSSVEPEFDYDYAFPLPTDSLRLLPKAEHNLDWIIENVDDKSCIVTNDGDTLEIRYIAKITDPTKFDMLFVYALAAKIAEHCCEELTQSNTKQQKATQFYKDTIAEARKINAFEQTVPEEPEDPWLAARR